jgi:membrane protein
VVEAVTSFVRGVKQAAHRFWIFASQDVWDIDLKSVSFFVGTRIRMVRVLHLIVRGFRDDNLTLHASALTYVTVLSLVPFVAFLVSILNGFGGSAEMLQKIHDWAAVQPEGIQTVVEQMLGIVQQTNFLALGGSAMLFLFMTVIKMLGSIEASFNQVWGVQGDRSIIRKVTDYISTLVVGLLFLLFVATFSLDTAFDKLGIFSGLATWAAKLLPLMVTWLAFSFVYAFMPNTRVKLIPALLSGLLGAVLWISWLRFFSWAQVGVYNYNQIFGTFAAIPIFLFWLYVCWVIVLVGVEAAFAFQNTTTFEKESAARQASMETRLKLALAIIARTAAALVNDDPRFDREKFAKDYGISIRLINRVLRLLQRHRLLAEVKDSEGEFILTRSPDQIAVQDVIRAVFSDGVQPETLGVHTLDASVENSMKRIGEVLKASFDKMTIEQLVVKDWLEDNRAEQTPESTDV